MATQTFSCSIVTPERSVLEADDATFVAIPAHDGEIGILKGRSPLLCQLGIGTLRVERDGEVESFYVDRGFAQMVDNKLTVLTEQAKRAGEIDRQQAAEALVSAEAMPFKGSEEMWADERMVAIRRAKTQIALADKSSSD
ncbi:MAG: ATP synthase F1 subunit epsilon [Acidobacteriota bacterium]